MFHELPNSVRLKTNFRKLKTVLMYSKSKVLKRMELKESHLMATQNKKNRLLAFRMFYTSLFRKLISKYILKDGS